MKISSYLRENIVGELHKHNKFEDKNVIKQSFLEKMLTQSWSTAETR